MSMFLGCHAHDRRRCVVRCGLCRDVMCCPVAPRNILFEELNQAVLADFGLSRRVQPSGEGSDQQRYQRTEGLMLPIRWYLLFLSLICHQRCMHGCFP